MKRIIIATLLLWIAGLSPIEAAAKKDGAMSAISYWGNVIMEPIKKTENLYIRVLKRTNGDASKDFTYSIARTPQGKMYFSEIGSYLFTKKTVVCVDDANHDIMVGKRKGDFYKSEYSNCITRRCEWFSPFLFPKQGIRFTSMYDTVIKGDSLKVLTRTHKSHFYNDSTGEFDLPNYQEICYYYNIQTHLVDYICVLPMDIENNNAWMEEYWLEYDFNVRDSTYNDIFNIEDKKYSQYSFHDDSNPPYSKTIYHTGTAEISDTLLQYPLVDMHGDSTTLADLEGWLLLDFWSFGCKSCYQWLQDIDKERNSPQGFPLDAEGIQVVSINPLSDNIEKIKELAQRFNFEEDSYSAKGICSLLDMRIQPKYYLLSPDKQIVYTSSFLGDYGELLEAKHRYEQYR